MVASVSDRDGRQPAWHPPLLDTTAADLVHVLAGMLFDADIGQFGARRFPARVPLSVLGDLGFGRNAIMTALAREVQRGRLTSTRVGRSAVYELTDAGEQIVSKLRLRVRGERPFSQSSVLWTLVSFTIAERRRDLRSKLRIYLTKQGFRPLRDGLWVALDATAAEEVLRGLDPELAENTQIDVFIATSYAGSGLAELIRRVWDVPDLRQRHEQFLARWEGYIPSQDRALPTLALAGAEWLALLRHDPGFPAESLGEDWPGSRSEVTATHLFNCLKDAAGAALSRLLTEDWPAN